MVSLINRLGDGGKDANMVKLPSTATLPALNDTTTDESATGAAMIVKKARD